MRIVLMNGMPRWAGVAAGVAAGALLLGGCGMAGGSDGSDSGVSVVAAAYPFAFVAERVGGNGVDVDNLTSPGVEPHDIELTPQQVADVSEADLLVYEQSFQPAVDAAVEQAGLSDDATLDVADVVPVDATGAEDEDAPDPHVWLDPLRMVAITRAVADRLSAVDPGHERTYQANAADLVDDLQALDRAYSRGLADCERTTVVTAHDAFDYLAARYGLDMVPISGIDPTQEPSPGQQAEIADTVEADGITTVFTEELVSPAVTQSIADETGATTATLSPIEGLTDETSDQDYLSLMRANLHALEEANGCS
jgi:zinc transport system substrate-binding protein